MVNTARLLEAVEANDTAYLPKLEVHDRGYDKIPAIYMGKAFIEPDHPEEDIYMYPIAERTYHHFFHRAKEVWYDAKGKEHHLKQFEIKVDWASGKMDYDKHFKRTVTLVGDGWFGTVTEAFCAHRGWMLLAWQHLTGGPLPEMTEKEYKAMTDQIKKPKAQTAKAKKSNEEDFVDATSEARGTKSQNKRKMELDADSVERMVKKPEPSKQKKG
ncbi:hypothetical protein LTR27_006408 [Elasticomyces elasticus]|nr:hypothetical protein LTR27_006408 [Elasticomyces elasticus]